MTLRELIAEMRKQLKDREEDGDFGPRGKALRGTAPERGIQGPFNPASSCGPGTVRQRKADGSSSCVALRGAKRY